MLAFESWKTSLKLTDFSFLKLWFRPTAVELKLHPLRASIINSVRIRTQEGRNMSARRNRRFGDCHKFESIPICENDFGAAWSQMPAHMIMESSEDVFRHCDLLSRQLYLNLHKIAKGENSIPVMDGKFNYFEWFAFFLGVKTPSRSRSEFNSFKNIPSTGLRLKQFDCFGPRNIENFTNYA